MNVDPDARWASLRLAPGATTAITKDEWFHFLEHGALLHQWSNVFLLDESAEGASSLVRVYLRDDSGADGSLCRRLDEAASARAREGVEEIEELSRAAADLITVNQGRTSLSPDDLGAEQTAGSRLVDHAEAVYAALLGAGDPPGVSAD